MRGRARKLGIRVFAKDGQRRASFLLLEEAAAFVATLGDSASVRVGHTLVWREGQELRESYDDAVEVMRARLVRS